MRKPLFSRLPGRGRWGIHISPRAWRNGRRARLRIWFRKEWRFKSSRAHHLLERLLRIFPFELEFQFLAFSGAFVFDVEGCAGGNVQALAGDLDRERAAGFDRVREAAQFSGELPGSVTFLQVAILPSLHVASHDARRDDSVKARVAGAFRVAIQKQAVANPTVRGAATEFRRDGGNCAGKIRVDCQLDVARARGDADNRAGGGLEIGDDLRFGLAPKIVQRWREHRLVKAP